MIVADLNLRQKGMQLEIENQNKLITENDNHIKAFINDLLESHQAITVRKERIIMLNYKRTIKN